MTDTYNFLGSIADYFTAGEPSRPAPATLTFIFPNKRSALFLKKYFRQRSHDVTLMPRFMTMRTFIGIYSDYPAAQPRELLFVLYDAYRNVMSHMGRADDIRQFDSFVFWGDMMLNDFDDVDRALVDADDIFRNLRYVKEIQADYLDDDQKEIIRRVWGESRLTAHIEEFWLHLGSGEKHSLGEKFIYLWEILADIYHEYKSELKACRRASEGTQYRQAAANTANYDLYDFTGDTRYVFVGFNDLGAAETVIFERFKRAGVAYFFWDTAPLALFAGTRSDLLPRTLTRLSNLVTKFPMPDDYSVHIGDIKPKITVTSVPSNVAQAKCAGPILKEWISKGNLNPDNALNTAIILPDQGLLLPTLLNIPGEIETLNISMGLAYRTTTFASLLHAIISMQLRARMIRGEYCYYFEDLNTVLSHPHIQTIASADADTITRYVNSNKLYNAPVSELCSKASSLAPIFTPVHKAATVDEVASYLRILLDWLGAALRQNIEQTGKETGRNFELKAIKYFRQELDKLTDLIRRHKVEMADHTFLHLFERIFTSRGLTLTGTPLQGLQVLGVLETRSLDFDNVIILSMNENIFPRKQYTKTMIPNNLRKGFGLSDFESPEWTYAYSFYRLIARAKHVALLYDSRSDGIGQGERSRYISQLEYLVPNLQIENRTLSIGADASERNRFSVTKTEKIMESLRRYRGGGSKKLSASSLKKYLECPFRFYLEYVRDMRDDDDLTEGLSAAEIGTIVHNSIQELYGKHLECTIDAPLIDSWLNTDNGKNLISDIISRQIGNVHFAGGKANCFDEFSPELRIAATNLEVLVRSNLEAERNAYCNPSFTFKGNEVKLNTLKENIVWGITSDIDINFYMSIDRVDQIRHGLLRFIDFKTGSDELGVDDLDKLFGEYKHSKGGLFQLMLYCEAYIDLVDGSVDIQPMLHQLRKLAGATPIKPLTINRKAINSYREIRNEFRPRLERLITEIFNPDIPFRQCDDTKSCEFCPFLSLCGRTIKKY